MHGDPAIRFLELLSECERAVAGMLPHAGTEPAYFSRQLAVLRRGPRKEGRPCSTR